mmetsp:Transcript_35680/g.112115  ORF Transcript_35680/g.112115 Transcript_35680/m.112115 type:complete len:228 (-) Transcript_35680:797-1480(-)
MPCTPPPPPPRDRPGGGGGLAEAPGAARPALEAEPYVGRPLAEALDPPLLWRWRCAPTSLCVCAVMTSVPVWRGPVPLTFPMPLAVDCITRSRRCIFASSSFSALSSSCRSSDTVLMPETTSKPFTSVLFDAGVFVSGPPAATSVRRALSTMSTRSLGYAAKMRSMRWLASRKRFIWSAYRTTMDISRSSSWARFVLTRASFVSAFIIANSSSAFSSFVWNFATMRC